MRLEMVIGMGIGIVYANVVGLFSNETFEKRPRTMIEDSDLHSDNRFEPHLLGNGLYQRISICECNELNVEIDNPLQTPPSQTHFFRLTGHTSVSVSGPPESVISRGLSTSRFAIDDGLVLNSGTVLNFKLLMTNLF